MKHRIVVHGAGYAGAFSVTFLARQLHSDDFEITVVNAEPDFVERLRPHQLAVGQELRHRPLAKVFARTDIRLRLARVTSVDVEHRTVTPSVGGGVDRSNTTPSSTRSAAPPHDHGVPASVVHTAASGAGRRCRRCRGRPAADGWWTRRCRAVVQWSGRPVRRQLVSSADAALAVA